MRTTTSLNDNEVEFTGVGGVSGQLDSSRTVVPPGNALGLGWPWVFRRNALINEPDVVVNAAVDD
jgi:hypothetical protein